MTQKINIIFPKELDFNGIKPKIPVEVNGETIVATIVRLTVTAEGAHFVVDIPKEVDAKAFIKGFEREKGVVVYKRALVNVDKDACLECGHCASLCAYDALVVDEEYSLVVNVENCTGCRACVDCCPRRAISVS